MSTYALLLSITLVRTDKILCLAVNIILGLDKISLPECTEASLLKCPTFSPGTMGSTRAFAVHPGSVLFEGSHTGASFPPRHSLGSVMQRPHKTFISELGIGFFEKQQQKGGEKIKRIEHLFVEFTIVLLISDTIRHQP